MKYAVCNELFKGLAFPEHCALAAREGFQGLELAPFTLAEDPRSLSRAQVRALRRTMEEAGLSCAGLHWLLASPPGFHITTGEEPVRRKSWQMLRFLADLCGELGGSVMVLGSPRQRNAVGMPVGQARENLIRGFRELAPALERGGVKILMEALSSEQTNLVNTLAQAREVIDAVGSPWVQGMFDFHNCRDERAGWDELLEQHYRVLSHVHLNATDGSYPKEAAPEYVSAFRVLKDRGYEDWVSLEIFHFDEPAEEVLRGTRQALAAIERKLAA